MSSSVLYHSTRGDESSVLWTDAIRRVSSSEGGLFVPSLPPSFHLSLVDQRPFGSFFLQTLQTILKQLLFGSSDQNLISDLDLERIIQLAEAESGTSANELAHFSEQEGRSSVQLHSVDFFLSLLSKLLLIQILQLGKGGGKSFLVSASPYPGAALLNNLVSDSSTHIETISISTQHFSQKEKEREAVTRDHTIVLESSSERSKEICGHLIRRLFNDEEFKNKTRIFSADDCSWLSICLKIAFLSSLLLFTQIPLEGKHPISNIISLSVEDMSWIVATLWAKKLINCFRDQHIEIHLSPLSPAKSPFLLVTDQKLPFQQRALKKPEIIRALVQRTSKETTQLITVDVNFERLLYSLFLFAPCSSSEDFLSGFQNEGNCGYDESEREEEEEEEEEEDQISSVEEDKLFSFPNTFLSDHAFQEMFVTGRVQQHMNIILSERTIEDLLLDLTENDEFDLVSFSFATTEDDVGQHRDQIAAEPLTSPESITIAPDLESLALAIFQITNTTSA